MRQTISVPKDTKFVEFQLDLNGDDKNDVLIELQFIERTHLGRWGFVVILPNGKITGKLNAKPNEPWTIVEIELESKKIDIDVIREPEDDSIDDYYTLVKEKRGCILQLLYSFAWFI